MDRRDSLRDLKNTLSKNQTADSMAKCVCGHDHVKLHVSLVLNCAELCKLWKGHAGLTITMSCKTPLNFAPGSGRDHCQSRPGLVT